MGVGPRGAALRRVSATLSRPYSGPVNAWCMVEHVVRNLAPVVGEIASYMLLTSDLISGYCLHIRQI